MLYMQTATQGDNAAPVLSGAILFYQSGRHGKAASTVQTTIHDVASIRGRPEIMQGRLLTNNDLVKLVKDLTQSKGALETQWLDQSVLGKGPDRMIWWTPPQKRAMFFRPSSKGDGTFEGSGLCPVPGLVWVSMPAQGLFVYAVHGTERPTPQTTLCQAPLFNVWGNGKVCVGTAALPKAEQHCDTKAWEAVMFDSHFTHPNFTEVDRLIKGVDPVKFWKSMVKKSTRSFPDKKLVDLPLVVGDLLDPLLLDKLRKLPIPKGQF